MFKFFNDVGLNNVLRCFKKNKLTVLSLHRISEELDFFWNPMKPKTFEFLLAYLKKHYHVICFRELPEIVKVKGTKPLAIISFDDGYYDFYEYALPLLMKYKLPSNHNIVNECAENNMIIWTQRLNFIFNHCRQNKIAVSFEKNEHRFELNNFNNNWMSFYLAVYKWMLQLPLQDRLELLVKHENALSISASVKMMNWQQIAECSANGVEVGSHTFSHDVISTINDEVLLNKEIVQSTRELEQKINKKVNVLALPNGQGNVNITKCLTEAKINYLLYVEDKLNELNNLTGTINKIYRINLVEENVSAMKLRTEMFHSKIKKYA